MEPLTLFTWGYYGWGSAPDQLVKAVDAVEASRGYKPPMFVDVRLSRDVRAVGFKGHAFERTVGPSRYRWMDSLGNVAVKEGGPMRLKDPSAARTLLDLAQECARRDQRILFFCSCEFPKVDGQDGCCHRTLVARLVLEAAEKRKLQLQVVEWPGGEPRVEGFEVQLSQAAYKKVLAGGASIPLEEPVALADMAAVPWCSLVTVSSKDQPKEDEFLVVTGPVRYRSSGWYLQAYDIPPEIQDDEIPSYARDLHVKLGFGVRRSQA